MYLRHLALLCFLVLATFVSAIPHKGHAAFHHAKKRVTALSVVTVTSTVTDYGAIVWVNSEGNVLRTENRGGACQAFTVTPVASASPLSPVPSSLSSTTSASTFVAAQNTAASAMPPTQPLTTSPAVASSIPTTPTATVTTSLLSAAVAHTDPATPVVTSVVTPVQSSSVSLASAVSATPLSSMALDSQSIVALSSESSEITKPSSSVDPSSSVNSAASTTTGIPEKGSDGQGSVKAPPGFGICYDTIDGFSKCKSTAIINTDFAFIRSQGYAMVRVYDITCPLGDYLAAAGSNGLRLMVGLNTVSNLNGDLNTLIEMVNGNWGTIDTVYIGNEVVNNGGASAASIAGSVSTAKGILSGVGFNGNVITVDTSGQMMTNPTICSTSSYCAINTHAFFDSHALAAHAGDFVRSAYQSVQAANPGKRVVVSESGWPYQGSCNGDACPSQANQIAALNSITAAFGGQAGDLFLFQAYDAAYKQPGAYGVEPFFGIYDPDHYSGGF